MAKGQPVEGLMQRTAAGHGGGGGGRLLHGPQNDLSLCVLSTPLWGFVVAVVVTLHACM